MVWGVFRIYYIFLYIIIYFCVFCLDSELKEWFWVYIYTFVVSTFVFPLTV